MKLVLSQEDGTLFLQTLHIAVKEAKNSESKSWGSIMPGLVDVGKTYKKHGFGFVSFDIKPSTLFEIKAAFIREGRINSTALRKMIMRVDESLSLFYRINKS